MGTTPGGIVYPDPTDAPDVPADLQALAESVETEFLTGGAWSTSVTGFTAATNFTLSSVKWRVVGPLCQLYVRVGHPSGTITAAATDSDVTNTDILSAIPVALTPTSEAVLVGPADSSNTSRNIVAVVTTGGKIVLVAMTGTSNWTTQATSFGGTYLLG